MLNPLFYFQALALALSQIWANKLRSFLTALGIIIGVASVSAVIAALSGLKGMVLSEVESFGANKLFIFPDRPDNEPRNKYTWEQIRLKPRELQAIREHCPSIRVISPVTDLRVSVEYAQSQLESAEVMGIWPDWHEIERRSVILGRPFTQIDENAARQVCMINDQAIQELKLPRDPVGTHILIDGRRFLIIGVVETIQRAIFGMEANDSELFLPFSTAVKLQPSWFFFHIRGLIRRPELAEEAKSEVTFVLRRMRDLRADDANTFRVQAIDEYIDRFKTIAAGITAIAGGIVGISLLVGGIGIMNTMLVSVSERTREIGLRKAVGATPAAILMQFLVEAVTLCMFGGFLGVAIAELFAFGLTKIPDAHLERADVPWWAVVLAFAFSGLVGVMFGMFPAIKAARLDPIDALRHE